MMARIIAILTFVFAGFALQTPAHAGKVELIFDSNELLKEGKRSLRKGHLEEAAGYYEEALRRRNLSRPDMVQLRNDLCVAYMYLERFDEAIEQCELGIALMPNRWETRNNLGTVFLIQGDFENALRSYEKALRMNPKSRVLKFNHEIALQRAAEVEKQRARQEGMYSPDDNPDDFGHSSSAAGL